MEKTAADFTNTFRELSAEQSPESERNQDPEFQAWHARWQLRLGREGQSQRAASEVMRTANPTVIPRNHRVEEALAAAEEQGDLSVLHRLLAALASPYAARADLAPYQEPPANDCGYRTFCGT
jgi:uncharacterized protein YdiU (UPF0061 family)